MPCYNTRCMARTNIDIDDQACAEVMRRFRLSTKREAVNLALQTLAREPLSVDEARALRGTGWDGDLEAMRGSRGPVVLVDTSAWIEFLRDTGSPVCFSVDNLIAGDIATCHPVRLELLAGARDDSQLRDMHRLLARATTIPTRPMDYDTAAYLYRTCRRQGETIRNLIDCLIGAIAIRTGIPILHRDADFEALHRHTTLQLYTGQP